jgi:hypothetical protein
MAAGNQAVFDTTGIMVSNSGTDSDEYIWPGGDGVFDAVATWGGGNVSLEFLAADGSTWVAVGSDTTLSANGAGVFTLGEGVKIRANITTATAVYARARRAPSTRNA